jgi:hypothetical protein
VLEGGWATTLIGGPTNKGITPADHARECTAVTAIPAATQASASSPRARCDLPSAAFPAWVVDLRLAHALRRAVNHGIAALARMLQEALGVDIDGRSAPSHSLLRATSLCSTPTPLSAAAVAARSRTWRFGKAGCRADVTPARVCAKRFRSAPAPSTPAPHVSRYRRCNPCPRPATDFRPSAKTSLLGTNGGASP